jgi:DNA-directed RNA polymerase subunit omega
MKSKYLDSAIQQIPSPELLVNLVSRRVRQLTQGHRPMTQTDPKMDYTDIALKEISEGKIGYELPTGPEGIPHSNSQEI